MNIEAERTIQAGQWRANVFGRRFRVIGRSNRDEFIWVIEFDYDGDYELTAVLASELVHSKLIRNADGNAVEPPEPEPPREIETEVWIASPHNKGGTIRMRYLKRDGSPLMLYEPSSCGIAQQGDGANGWTCIGFRFREVPERIFPLALAFTTLIHMGIKLFSFADYVVPTVATHAVWRRL